MKAVKLLAAGAVLAVAVSLAGAQNNTPAAAPDGALLYQNYCAACHMSDGRGAEGAGRYPNLAGNPAVEVSPQLVVMRILKGMGAMPAFASQSNENVAAIVNHVRTELNSATEEIDAQFVEAMR